MPDFSKFISWNYWTDSFPGMNFEYLIPTLIIFALIILVGILIQVRYSKKRVDKKLFKQMSGVPGALYWFGGIGLLLTFFRYEGIQILSMRLFMLILFVAFVTWLIRFRIKYRREFKNAPERVTEVKVEDKYKPVAKKSKKKKKR